MLDTITILARPDNARAIPLKVRILRSVANRHGVKPFQTVSTRKAYELSQESKAAREGGATR